MGTGATAGKVISIAITMPASTTTNALSRPTAITIAAPAKSQATATATVLNNIVTGVTITSGAGYVTAPTVSIAAANVTSSAATATATVVGGVVTSINGLPSGNNYTVAPTVTLTPVIGISAP